MPLATVAVHSATCTAQSSRPGMPYSRVPSSGSMIHTRSADSRAGESTDSSDSTASSGRASASPASSNSFASWSPRLPSSLPSSPDVGADRQQQLAGPPRELRGEVDVGRGRALAHWRSVSSLSMTIEARVATSASFERSSRSGDSGASYGALTPVKSGISPARAFA